MKKVFSGAMCAFMVSLVLTSCEPANEGGEARPLVSNPDVFILCEGLWEANNAEISAYNSTLMQCTEDYFYRVNRRYLGDTGQDILYHDGYLYVSVSGSSYVAKLDLQGCELCRRSISLEEGQPRYLAAQGDYIYVTLYSGRVAKMRASDLIVEGYAEVGLNPESIVVYEDQLLVANSGWGNDSTMTVIDAVTFQPSKTIAVEHNPQRLVVSGDSVYLLAYGKDYVTSLQSVDVAQGIARTIADATHAVAYDGVLYLCNSVTDYSTLTTRNTFFSYDVATATLNNANFLQGDTSDITSNPVYMMEVDPSNGDLYIGLAGSKYVSSGKVYRYDCDGILIDAFDVICNPNQAAFLNNE